MGSDRIGGAVVTWRELRVQFGLAVCRALCLAATFAGIGMLPNAWGI